MSLLPSPELHRLHDAVVACQARLNDPSIAVRAERGLVQIVRVVIMVDREEDGEYAVKPLSDYEPVHVIIERLNRMERAS